MDVNESKGGSGEDIFDDSALEGIDFEGIGTLVGNDPLPILPLSIPSGGEKALRASSAKHSRFRRILGRVPSVDDSVATPSNGAEQWTPQDDADFREYRRKQQKGDFIQPLPILPLPSPRVDEAALRASSAKSKRFRRVLRRAPNVGDSIANPSKGIEEWTPQDDADFREYRRKQQNGDFVQPLPILSLPDPSVDEAALRASSAKSKRFRRVLGRAPSVDDSVATPSNGAEQWTPQDAADFREYLRKQKKGDLVQPLPILSLPDPSVDESALRASKAKHGRFKKVLGTAPKEGDSITFKKGLEQWTLQDTADFREYKRRHTKRKASSDTVREETNIGFSAFLAPMNSDRTKDDGSSKKRKSDSDQKSPSKRPGLR